MRGSIVSCSPSTGPAGFHRLYYCANGHTLAFATRLELLIHRCGWQAKPNEQTVVNLLRFGGVVTEASLLEGIYRVLPGHSAVFEGGHVIQEQIYKHSSPSDRDPFR